MGRIGSIAAVHAAALAALLLAAAAACAQPAPGTVRVPNFIGDTRERTFAKVPDDQLRLRFVETPASGPPGRVLQQSPAANTVVRRGAEVQLAIAGPQAGSVVPSVIGLPVNEALARLSVADEIVLTIADDTGAATVYWSTADLPPGLPRTVSSITGTTITYNPGADQTGTSFIKVYSGSKDATFNVNWTVQSEPAQ